MKSIIRKCIQKVAKAWHEEFFKQQRLFEGLDMLKTLKLKHSGKRCFIIGNGPSLKLADVEKLETEVTFASNKIYLLFKDTNWKPTYYSAEDNLVIKQNYNQIRRIEGTTKIFPVEFSKYFLDLPNMIYFNSECLGVYENPLASPDFPGFSFDVQSRVYWGSTIIYTQIQLAAYMGFKEIYLLGVDFTYDLPDKKKGQFYISQNEKNHFHPDYRKAGEKWNRPNLDVHDKSFNYAKEKLQTVGVNIYNATRGGSLEIFDRVDLDQLLKK